MKKFIVFLIAVVAANIASAQDCLPEGITFTTQAQIDSFQIKYPVCTEIEGDVTVSGSEISNLRGLSKLTSIRGSLNIDDNNFLRDLTGLNSLKAIGGTFQIRSNFAFTYQSAMVNLNGLDNLTSVGGNLIISGGRSIFGGCIYPALTSLAGLEKLTFIGGGFSLSCLKINDFFGLGNLKSIGGDLFVYYTDINNFRGMENLSAVGGNFHLGFEQISSPDGFGGILGNNQYLTSFAGLNNLTFIGGSIEILGQQSLTSFSGLENLDSIGGSLIINQNSAITSLSGLENLDAGSITGLTIINNPSLSTCDVQSVCNYLANPTGSVIINGNATGCNNPPEVAGNCGIKLHCLPYGIYNFQTQSDIDSFEINYSNCTELEGDVTIGGGDISNLNGLSTLTSIGGNFYISSNFALTSLKGLENLKSIGGYLNIYANPVLTSLMGLENLDAGSITKLAVCFNPSLSTCHVQSVCSYLVNPTGLVFIYDNAPGCNSPDEVKAACSAVSVNDFILADEFPIYPNPATNKISIATNSNLQGETIVSIFNMNGAILKQEKCQNQNLIEMDVSTLAKGFYLIKIQTNARIETKKLVVQ